MPCNLEAGELPPQAREVGQATCPQCLAPCTAAPSADEPRAAPRYSACQTGTATGGIRSGDGGLGQPACLIFLAQQGAGLQPLPSSWGSTGAACPPTHSGAARGG